MAPTTNASGEKFETLLETPVSDSSSKIALENNDAADGVMADDNCSGGDDPDDVMATAMTYLEEDCRLLRAQK